MMESWLKRCDAMVGNSAVVVDSISIQVTAHENCYVLLGRLYVVMHLMGWELKWPQWYSSYDSVSTCNPPHVWFPWWMDHPLSFSFLKAVVLIWCEGSNYGWQLLEELHLMGGEVKWTQWCTSCCRALDSDRLHLWFPWMMDHP